MHVNGMQERIDRLENLVASLVSESQGLKTQRPCSDGSTSKDTAGIQSSSASGSVAKDASTAYEEVQSGVGVMRVNEHYSLYRGATHWSDVLQEVSIMSCRVGQT
jgi:hypothetical protein